MRRKYYRKKKTKSEKVRAEAMDNYRSARERINPGILEKVGRIIQLRMEREKEAVKTEEDLIPIDREKNLAIVKKYMELKDMTRH